MANHKSAEKRNRQRITRTERNRAAKSEVRGKVKKARVALAASGTEATKPATDAVKPADAAKLVADASSALDRAASKGSIHPKAAARRKSRLAKALHKASVAAPTSLRPEAVLAAPTSALRERPLPHVRGARWPLVAPKVVFGIRCPR